MRYLLDTNICIYIINNRHPAALLARFAQFAPTDIGISTIVLSELEYGVAKSTQVERNQQRLRDFLLPFAIVPYDAAAARAYGLIRATLERQGQPIGREDLMIAAHAHALGVTLVTNNGREFGRVPDLTVENWTEGL